ncbi:spore coat protein GerQ [Calidifontibacillus erzurumensis]|uniref:Spore coat protein GerQ n=1 Tax=Calidifontibacillus erzurumensis TaxID=2741433 RepID=A0A8J8KFJ1_9BACI|nr:spore coat protein GerQ [Calidifontibacillus erzurumensis]NSL52975.1 spore coat protein GerQ [Calidifontibacillus erzurumensis]
MAKKFQTSPYGQYPQFGFQQQVQVPTVSGGFFPGVGIPQTPTAPSVPTTPTAPQIPGMLPIEESYIENILRLNKGKIATVYATFENNKEWNAKIFKGAIEAAGRDHLILSDQQTGTRYLIPMIYVDYVTFDEEINYEYPFASGMPGLASFSPR